MGPSDETNQSSDDPPQPMPAEAEQAEEQVELPVGEVVQDISPEEEASEDEPDLVDIPEEPQPPAWQEGNTLSYSGPDAQLRRELRKLGGPGIGIAALCVAFGTLLIFLLQAAWLLSIYRYSGFRYVIMKIGATTVLFGVTTTLILSAHGLARPLARPFAIASRIVVLAVLLATAGFICWYDNLNQLFYVLLMIFLVLPMLVLTILIADGIAGR